jgi:aryl-alcohol dehydrogenase-like predicted oxidoreductase
VVSLGERLSHRQYAKGAAAGGDTRGGSGTRLYDHIFGDLAAKNRNWSTLETVREIAKEIGATPSQVALSWVTNRPGVTSPIIGARILSQLESNLAAADLDLSQEATERLTNVSAPTSNDYPTGRTGSSNAAATSTRATKSSAN